MIQAIQSPELSVAQDTYSTGDLVRVHVGTTPYGGVIVDFKSSEVALVRVRKLEGLETIEVNVQSLSIR
jgi:hypothetical protein